MTDLELQTEAAAEDPKHYCTQEAEQKPILLLLQKPKVPPNPQSQIDIQIMHVRGTQQIEQ